MKKIEAIIRSSKFEDVKESLSEIGINFFTFFEVKGFGKQKGEHVTYRGQAYDIGYIARMKIEIIIPDSKEIEIVSNIRKAAHTGEIGDGKIIVTRIEQMIGIRTGELDQSAL